MPLKPFSVFGFYEDSRQRFLDHVNAEDAVAAEKAATAARSSTLFICGVIEGTHTAADNGRPYILNKHGECE